MAVPLYRPLALLSVVLGALPVSGLLNSGGPLRHRTLSWPSAATLPPLLGMVIIPSVSIYFILNNDLSEFKGIGNPFSIVFNLSAVVAPILLLFVAQWMKAGKIAAVLQACADLRESSASRNDRRWMGAAIMSTVGGDALLLLWCAPTMEGWKLGTLASAGIYGKLLRMLVLWQMLSILLDIGDRFQDVCRLLEESPEVIGQQDPAASEQLFHRVAQTACESRRGSVYEYSHCPNLEILSPATNGLSISRAISPDSLENMPGPFSNAVCCSCYHSKRQRKRPTPPSPRDHKTVTDIAITINSSTTLARIELLRHRHAATARVLGLFNEAFGIQLLMLTLFSFSIAVGVALPEYDYLSIERRVPITVSQLAMSLMNIGSLCLAGQRVATAARRPLVLLNVPGILGEGSLQKQQETGLEEQLETRLETVQATLQLQTSEGDVSAAGVFYVNSSTLLSAVAALVTYGVILQQISPVPGHGTSF